MESIWKPNLKMEAQKLYKTTDKLHPAVNFLSYSSNKVYLGGKIEEVMMPNHYDYEKYRLGPKDVKNKFKKWDGKKIIAFQTRNPLHKAHVEMTFRSMKKLNANLLIHPVVGQTKAGDIDHHTRIRCYEHVIKKYPKNTAFLALLPLSMRMGGPREALLHAIIRKNYGCTHIIIGRDHADQGLDSYGEPFYEPYEAQELVKQFETEIGIQMIKFQFMVFVPKYKEYRALESLHPDTKYEIISGTDLRKRLDKNEALPEWFSYPEVSRELKKLRPPLYLQGFTVFLLAYQVLGNPPWQMDY